MPITNSTFCPPWFTEFVPDPFDRDDYDKGARGIRNKPDRYRAIVRKWLSMTSEAIRWDLSSIIPDAPPQMLEIWLQVYGWAALIRKEDQFHIVSGNCAGFIGQYDEYYMPAGIIVTNPYARGIDGNYYFGKDAILIRSDAYMQGLLPIMEPRGEMEVELEISILQGLENLRIVNIIHATTDKMMQAAKTFFRQIKRGRAGIVTGSDSKTKWSGSAQAPVIENLPTGGVPANYMIQFIETAAYNKSTLYTDLGIRYNGNMKREALNPEETTMNDAALRPLIDDMMQWRRAAVREANTLFGIRIPEPELAGAWAIKAAEDQIDDQSEDMQEENQNETEEETTEEVTGDEDPA